MKISVAGTGYVGLVTAVCLAENGHNVVCVDVDAEKISTLSKGIPTIYEPQLEELLHKNLSKLSFTTDYKSAYKDADVIFIGVGTPENPDGTANFTYVKSVCEQIGASIQKDVVVVVKSTVPVGTNDRVEEMFLHLAPRNIKVEIVSNPEFLAQGNAINDTLHAKRIVIGTKTEHAVQVMHKVYDSFGLPLLFTDRRSAEMIKYASNDFLALKISYMNDIANICELVGANIEEVKKGMSYDPRIGSSFLNAGIGYGGSCFPKDTKALYTMAKNEYGYEAKTIKAAIDVNASQKVKLFYQAKKICGSLKGVKTAVLGLTFKPGTDDMREAPSIDIINLLLKEGAIITGYDPIGQNACKRIFKDRIIYADSPAMCVASAEVVFVVTEWPEIKKMDIDLLNNKVVLDGRNVFDVNATKKMKKYYSIGR
ncbi:MAG: UDP-glucose/GDP-mannose dehydrogenase family protein [Bacilli bacterium]|jgi:UDPglucose 6-dehydrogenase